MLVKVKLSHTREKREAVVDLWDFDGQEVAKIMQSSVVKDRIKVLDAYVYSFINGRLGPGWRHWRIASWQLADHSEAEGPRYQQRSA